MENRTDTASTADGEKLLDELQALLEKQVGLARNGQAEEVSSLVARVDELLAELSACRSLPRDGVKAERIRRLYNELCLILIAGKSELAQRLKKMQKGRNSLLAYQDALGGR